jgi:hypothetical protein
MSKYNPNNYGQYNHYDQGHDQGYDQEHDQEHDQGYDTNDTSQYNDFDEIL